MKNKAPYQMPVVTFLEETMAAMKTLEEMQENYESLNEQAAHVKDLVPMWPQIDSLGGQLCEAYRNIKNITSALKLAFPADLIEDSKGGGHLPAT